MIVYVFSAICVGLCLCLCMIVCDLLLFTCVSYGCLNNVFVLLCLIAHGCPMRFLCVVGCCMISRIVVRLSYVF